MYFVSNLADYAGRCDLMLLSKKFSSFVYITVSYCRQTLNAQLWAKVNTEIDEISFNLTIIVRRTLRVLKKIVIVNTVMELRLKFFICFQKFKGQTGFNLFLTILQNHLIIYVVKQVTSALCSFSFFDASSLTASDRTSVTCGFYCLSFSNIDLLHNLHYDRGRSCLFCRFQSKSLRIFLIFEFLNFCLF